MGKAWCVNAELDTTKYASPMPIIGLYIAGATVVSFLSMGFDLLHGFIHRKPYLPCKLFPLNSFTLTILAVATKISVDLTTSMPRDVDQFSKLTSNALLCISIGFFMPSLGGMNVSERYANVAALSIMVITVVVNVFIQMITGVVFAFTIEHVIIMVCLLVVLLLLWSSTLAIKGQSEYLVNRYRWIKDEDNTCVKELQWLERLRNLLGKSYVCSCCGNPQSVLCQTSYYHAVALLCTLTSAIVLEAGLRSFVIKELKFCSGVSDYKWSVPLVVMIHILTILVGGFAIIFRGLITLNHMSIRDRLQWELQREDYQHQTMELQYLRFHVLSFKALAKTATNISQVAKALMIDVLIAVQIGVHCGSYLIVIPFYILKISLAWVVKKLNIKNDFEICFSNKHIEDVEVIVSSVPNIKNYGIIFEFDTDLNDWMTQISMDRMMRWMKVNKRDSPIHLTQLLSKPISESPCTYMESLGQTANRILENTDYEYRVSCVTVLALARLIANVIPPPNKESPIHSLFESFEIIYFVDQKTNISSSENEMRWMAAKTVRMGWENPHHWFQKKVISRVFRSYSKKTFTVPSKQGLAQDESELDHTLGIIGNAIGLTKEIVGNIADCIRVISKFGSVSLERKHQYLMILELLIICEFILEYEFSSIAMLYDFLETTFAQMLRFLLSGLPLAIFNEVDGDPYEVGEERVKNAMKFFCKLEMLGSKVQWSWPTGFDTESQPNPLIRDHVSSSCNTAAVSECKSEADISTASFTRDNGENAALLCDNDKIIEEFEVKCNV